MVSIPAAEIVRVTPGVVSAGGAGLDLVGLVLTDSTQLPIGTVLSFPAAEDVSAYFGPLSIEAGLAAVYFAGYTGSQIKPATLRFSRFATAAAAAFLRGGNVSALKLSDLQALTGTLTIAVNGSNKTSSTINLSTATSFSNAATIIAAAFTSPGFVVSYDAISGGFLFTNSTTGASSTMSFATGSLAAGLRLTAATSATLSPGSDVMVAGTAMDAVIASTQDFVSFMTTFTPDLAGKLAFAAWADTKDNRFLYVAHDSDPNATTNGDTSSFGPQAIAAGYSSVFPAYAPSNGPTLAAFVMGIGASIDFSETNGRVTGAFRRGEVTAGVTNATVARNLIANGYNFVGSYATANDQFTWLYPGQVTGDFAWLDSWLDQAWLNASFQLELMLLLQNTGSIPYNADGYGMIETALLGPINAALNFGAIRTGVTLSASQVTQINNAAGKNVADTVQQRGWYVKVSDASPEVRAARGSPPVHVWYTDGQSVQRITLSSDLVQ